MKGFQPRFYRNHMGEGRFRSFVIGYKDSDLWIGVDHASFNGRMQDFAQAKLIELRKELEAYILLHPEFASSFAPLKPWHGAPELGRMMALAGTKANTGPMAAVAGAFSEYLGKALLNEFNINELVVENGGDLFLLLKRDLVLSVYAGTSPLTGKVGLEIPASETPLGICTSAGTVGPSFSFGKADAVVVACKDTLLADAFATSIGNKVKSAASIHSALETIDEHPEIQALLIICEGAIGIKGQFKLKLLSDRQ